MSTAKSMLRTMVLALAGMVLVFFLVGSLLADRWQVDTARQVTGAPERVRALVHDFTSWQAWSSMKADLGAGTRLEITGAPGTVGHRVTWTGNLGTATLTVTAADAQSMAYDFHMQRPDQTAPELRGRGALRWRPEGGGSLVSWHDEAELDSFPLRWFGWFGALQEQVKQIQGTSLAGLQQALDAPAEARPK